MKLSIILFSLAFLNIYATGFNQETKLTMRHNNVSAKTVFMEIEKTTDYRFVYNDETVSWLSNVNVNARNKELGKILDDLLHDSDIEYRVLEDKLIVLTKSPALQEVRVTGRVTDAETGEPLPGASIIIQGTTIGVISDSDGNYTIKVPGPETVLNITYIGYLSQQFVIGERTVIDVELRADVIGIEEVVAIGYGTRERGSVTSAISSVRFEDIEDMGTGVGLDLALKGKVAGVMVRQHSGQAGDAPYIRIRGVSTLTAGNDPLWVIDGIPTTDRFILSNLNISGIQRIDVLKDAAATSIYGSRGANGVIIVTTNRGQIGETKFNVSLKRGWQKEEKRVDFLTGPEQIEYVKASRDNAWVIHMGGSLDDPMTERPFALQYSPEWNEPGFEAPHYDVQDFVFQPGNIHDLSLNASGGSDFGTFYVGVDYLNDEGIIRRTNYERASVRANTTLNLTDYMTLNINVNPSRSTTFMPGAYGTGSVLHNTITSPQMFPPDTGTGAPGAPPMPTYGVFRIEPHATAELLWLEDELIREHIMANASLAIDILPELQYKITGGYFYTSLDRQRFLDFRISNIRNNLPEGSYSGGSSRKYIGDQILSYDKIFNDIHNVSILVGQSVEIFNNFSSSIVGRNMPSDMIPTLNAATSITANTTASEWNLLSYFGRINYDYDNRYLFNVNFRMDGSSRFGRTNKWGLFPSASLAWRIENEDFFQSNVISRLKPRLSYGLMGNDQIGNYAHIATMGMAHYSFDADESLHSGYFPTNLGNDNLTWETTSSINFGFNIGLFADRIDLVVDAYRNITSDLLMNVSLPAHTGFNNQMMNIGKIMNEGIETQLTTRNFVGTFKWNTSLMFSLSDNEVLALGPEDAPILSGPWYNPANYTMVGHHVGAFYLLKQIGVWQTQEEIDNNPSWAGSRPGNERLLDWNGDGVVDERDRHMMGRVQPTYIFSLGNTFEYKNFDLSVYLEAAGGNHIIGVLMNRGFGSSSEDKAIKYGWWRDFWKSPEEPGDGMAPQPKAIRTGAQATWTDKALYDASYQRLRNIMLGYTFPSSLTRNIGLSKFRIYISGHNVWLNDNAPYEYNVEADLGGGQPMAGAGAGYVNSSHPLPRQILFGVDVSF